MRLLSFPFNCTTTLAVFAEVGDLAALADFGRVAPDVGPRAIDIRKAIVAREFTGADRLLIPLAAIRIGGERRHGAADIARRFRQREIGRRLWPAASPLRQRLA